MRQKWTLKELLTRFKQTETLALMSTVYAIRIDFEVRVRYQGLGGASLGDSDKDTILSIVQNGLEIFPGNEFHTSLRAALHMRDYIKQQHVLDYSSASTLLHVLNQAILNDASSSSFIQIRGDRVSFFPTERTPSGDLVYSFSPEVTSAFPSASSDINEAGYCMAVEANTAAVYHFMNAVEFGLRALAHDRRVKCGKGPIDLQQWGTLIHELDKSIDIIKKQWKPSKQRESATEYYSRLLQQCRAFNDGYRRHLAHARRHYNRTEALAVAEHVKSFMVLLSERIAEGKRTPLVWTRTI